MTPPSLPPLAANTSSGPAKAAASIADAAGAEDAAGRAHAEGQSIVAQARERMKEVAKAVEDPRQVLRLRRRRWA